MEYIIIGVLFLLSCWIAYVQGFDKGYYTMLYEQVQEQLKEIEENESGIKQKAV